MGFGQQMPSIRAERNFGLVIGGILAAFGVLLVFYGKPGMIAIALLALGVLLISLGTFAPKALIIPARLWMGLAAILSFIFTNLILALVFFIVITPIGLIKRLLGWDPLQRRSSSSTSYWGPYTPRQHDSHHYEKMF
jgi:hypothetical protein